MAQQWEVCRISYLWFGRTSKPYGYENWLAVDFFATSGVITKWPETKSFGEMIGFLSRADWELVTVQHADTGGWGITPHNDSNLLGNGHDHFDKTLKYENCTVVAYFRRPVESGRKIDNIFPAS